MIPSIVIRTIQKGEEVSVNYLNIWSGQPRRRAHLRNTWFFDCACPRCSDVTEFGTNLSAFKCESCCEGLILPNTTDLGNLIECYVLYIMNFTFVFVFKTLTGVVVFAATLWP